MNRLPITIITGANDEMLAKLRPVAPRAAWVVHDPVMLQAVSAATACACCRAGASMTATLLDLFRRKTRGEVPDFDRIMVTAPAGQAGDALAELNRSAAAGSACRVDAVTTWADGEDAWIADHTMGSQSAIEAHRLVARTWPETLGPPESIRARGDQSLETFVIGWASMQSLDTIGDWLLSLTGSVGERLLRVHGEVHTPQGQFAIEARSHTLAPPAPLPAPSAPGSRLRFVTLGLEPGDLLPGWACTAAYALQTEGGAQIQTSQVLEEMSP